MEDTLITDKKQMEKKKSLPGSSTFRVTQSTSMISFSDFNIVIEFLTA